MQKAPQTLVRSLTKPRWLVCLGFLSWPVCLGVLICSAHLNLPTQIAVFLGLTIMFCGLACCLLAVHARRVSFAKEFGLMLLVIGLWACIGRFTLYLMRSGLL